MSDQLTSYQRQIVRITKERDDARDQRDAIASAARGLARESATRLAEGLSPQNDALKLRLRRAEGDLVRGKEAIQAANRRAAAAEAELATAKAQIAAERDRIHEENEQLKVELIRFSRDIDAIATTRAEVIIEKLEAERRARGLDEAFLVYMFLRTEYLIMNACRYLSMTLGQRPVEVISIVLTWALGRDVRQPPKPTDHFLMGELGVPSGGWVATVLEQAQDPHWKHWDASPSEAVTLDRAQAEGYEQIHPAYKPHWYNNGPKVPQRPERAGDRKSIRLKEISKSGTARRRRS